MKKLLFIFLLGTIASCQKEPSASFSVSKDIVYVGDFVHCINTSKDGESYLWDDSERTENYSVNYQSEGFKSINLKAFSKDGSLSNEVSKTIEVKAKPLPTKCYITKVQINSFLTDNNGYYWDSSSDGYYADIYFKIIDDNSQVLFNYSSYIQNVTDNQKFSFSINESIPLNTKFYISLYDYDYPNTDEFMCLTGGYKPSDLMINDFAHNQPTTLNLEYESMKCTLTLRWE